MKRVCAWCGKRLGHSELSSGPPDTTTHGICKDCAYHLFAQIGMPLWEYLDGLGVPVVVLDSGGVVQTANKQARMLLHKELPDIQGYPGGDVFECAYAMLPEGCGHTIHCSRCAIRNTVTETFRTGTGRLRVPAYLNRGTPDGIHKVHLTISTEKASGMILLRIDAIDGQDIE